MNRLTFVLLLTTVLGTVLVGQGVWMLAKAALADVLIERAWQRLEDGEPSPRPWPWADMAPVARLAVPRLGVDEVVLSGAHGSALAFGPGQLDGTRLAEGNTVLAGHRETSFAFLRDVEDGDSVRLETPDGKVVRYRVTERFVTDDLDGSVLEPTSEDVLTLITCYPFEDAEPGGPLRYVVRAHSG